MTKKTLYNHIILDHYRNPRCYGVLPDPDFSISEITPLCGDSITVQGKIHDGKLTQYAFMGEGCIISQAAASLLGESILDKPVLEIARLSSGAFLESLGVELGSTRKKCALLGFEALKKGIEPYA